MSDLIELEDEDQNMGSLNHGIIQANMTSWLSNDKRFRVITELSLDASQTDLSQFGLKVKRELKPDICVYPNTIKARRRDVLRMSEMPSLAIEVVSPEQGVEEILAKFDAFFALGVKSCWLIVPTVKSVTVYSTPDNFRTFGTDNTEIIDEVLDIQMPAQKIFDW